MSGTEKAESHCIPFAPTSTMVWPSPRRPTEPSAVRFGSAVARCFQPRRVNRRLATGESSAELELRKRNASARTNEIPEDAKGSDAGHRVPRKHVDVRPVRLDGAATGVAHLEADRGRTRGDHPARQARRQALDSGVSRQADHQKAG